MLLFWSDFVSLLAKQRAIYFKEIVADAVSSVGAHLLSNMGFSFARSSMHESKIMTLNLFSENLVRTKFNDSVLSAYREYKERNGNCDAV